MSQEKEKENLELNSEEQQAITEMRIRKQKQLDCKEEIISVLKKFGGRLYIDPNSPHGNPSIDVQII